MCKGSKCTGIPLAIETSALADGLIGQPYSATLKATGGTLPYKWLISQGTLPVGILLDETGKVLSSEEFAQLLGKWRDEAVRETRFLIGAADGHGAAARESADLVLSFGALTWPHMLARAMLAEQLWRATSILAGHPYHRSG